MKKIKRFIVFVLVVLLAIAGVFIKMGYDMYSRALEEVPLNIKMENLRAKEHYTTYENVPQTFFDALVAVEDRRFYKHRGFDFLGTARAVYNDIRKKELAEGGSTISQQLAKNLYFMQERDIRRKIAEIFMAVNIERNYNKKDILEFYVNSIYYGSGYYCVYDASVGYFNKKPSDMTDDECALLAGIPNAPSVYSLDVNPDLAEKRKNKVLQCMKECGYIE